MQFFFHLNDRFALFNKIIYLAKCIAGGVPMGAVLCTDKIQLVPGKHGTTFGGNLLACAKNCDGFVILTKTKRIY